MIHICSKQSKIDKLWGRFIKHLIELRESGVKVEYIRKGEVILDGKRYEPFYMENTMRWEPIGWRYERNYITFTGYDIQPLITYLRIERERNQEKQSISEKYGMTAEELRLAYLEQQKIYDCQNISENLGWILDMIDTLYTTDELREDKEFLSKSAELARENQDSKDMAYSDALVSAVREVLKEMEGEE